MGYTHYWYINPNTPQKKLDKLKEDLIAIVYDGFQKGILGDGLGDKVDDFDIIANNQAVWFNGIDDESHETFSFELNAETLKSLDRQISNEEGMVFNCTKTAHKDYDIYVIMCLAVIKSYLKKDIQISSDGGDEVFLEAYEKAQKILSLITKKRVLKKKLEKL